MNPDERRVPIPLELQPTMVELELQYIKRGYRARPESAGGLAGGWARSWERTIGQIGSYRGDAFEYMNTIQRRKHLHEIAMLAYEREAFDVLDWLIPIVESLDEKFRAKTTPDIDRLFWNSTGNPACWWERRLPNDERLMDQFRLNRELEDPVRLAEHNAKRVAEAYAKLGLDVPPQES